MESARILYHISWNMLCENELPHVQNTSWKKSSNVLFPVISSLFNVFIENIIQRARDGNTNKGRGDKEMEWENAENKGKINTVLYCYWLARIFCKIKSRILVNIIRWEMRILLWRGKEMREKKNSTIWKIVCSTAHFRVWLTVVGVQYAHTYSRIELWPQLLLLCHRALLLFLLYSCCYPFDAVAYFLINLYNACSCSFTIFFFFYPVSIAKLYTHIVVISLHVFVFNWSFESKDTHTHNYNHNDD